MGNTRLLVPDETQPSQFDRLLAFTSLFPSRPDLAKELGYDDSYHVTYLHYIAHCLPDLEALCVGEPAKISAGGFLHRVKNVPPFKFPHLRSLNITNCIRMTAICTAMIESAPNLETLIAAGERRRILQADLHKVPKLRHVDVSGCYWHGQTDLQYLASLELLVCVSSYMQKFSHPTATILQPTLISSVDELQKLLPWVTSKNWCNTDGHTLPLAWIGGPHDQQVKQGLKLLFEQGYDRQGRITDFSWVTPFEVCVPTCYFTNAVQAEKAYLARKLDIIDLVHPHIGKLYNATEGFSLVKWLVRHDVPVSAFQLRKLMKTCETQKRVEQWLQLSNTKPLLSQLLQMSLQCNVLESWLKYGFQFPPRPLPLIIQEGGDAAELQQHANFVRGLHLLVARQVEPRPYYIGGTLKTSKQVIDLIDVMLEAGCVTLHELDDEGRDALQASCYAKMQEAKRKQATGEGEQPYWWYRRPQDSENAIIEYLIHRGADVNAKIPLNPARDVQTLLHCYCYFATDIAIKAALSDWKLDVAACNSRGEQPLFSAMQAQRMDVAVLLLQHGAPVVGYNALKPLTTALHDAASVCNKTNTMFLHIRSDCAVVLVGCSGGRTICFGAQIDPC
eukprot:TRINITY_DN1446_c0_g1_i1.p1 TRINITY_DN1446_c0_g1~~TRINITY_DN1446_c0_g1_i1.p1  ORF type:complete len:719 (+),score=124.48 TRINITY_DN1446_c0_g1_i1:305-2158(+)